MNYIKRLSIEGFKKFVTLQVDFNEHMNILVGENEAGKSTILDALRTVLNQQYRTSDKAVLRDLFNADMVSAFQANPSIKTLPHILIEVEFELDPKHKNADYFHGEVYGKRKQQPEKYGVRFECRFDEEIGDGLDESIREGKIPYEYYALTWMTFANRPYQMVKRPVNFISIDTTNNGTAASFNYYNKALFASKYDEGMRTKAKNSFRDQLDQAFEKIGLPEIDEKRKFGIDGKKVILEAILSVYENSVSLENRGSGMESLIKTKIALDKKSGLDVILVEEPENHLSFSTLQKMLKEISEKQEISQIIVATHSNMIASRLNLNNVLWITDDGAKSLGSVDSKVAQFFVKADDNSFLQLLLAKKTILVEGATEFLLVPYFYEKMTGRTIEDDEVTVISCNGISYSKYLAIAESTNKKIAVITDNDGKQNRIDDVSTFNKAHSLQHIFMACNVKDWTWEVCIYEMNQAKLGQLIEVQAGAKYLFHEKDYGPVLGKMLNNKVDVAYSILTSGEDFEPPHYVKDAITWISE